MMNKTMFAEEVTQAIGYKRLNEVVEQLSNRFICMTTHAGVSFEDIEIVGGQVDTWEGKTGILIFIPDEEQGVEK